MSDEEEIEVYLDADEFYPFYSIIVKDDAPKWYKDDYKLYKITKKKLAEYHRIMEEFGKIQDFLERGCKDEPVDL